MSTEIVENRAGESNENPLEEGGILTLLKRTICSPSSRLGKPRTDYERRLLSFQASTYYAKPALMSPLICARFGWRNADKDMLCCTSCKAALAVTIPSGLSPKAMERICSAYRQQLASAHQENCPFRLESEQVLRHKQAERPTIPTAFASVLPQGLVRLLEHPSPFHLLTRQISITNALPPSGWDFPTLVVSPEIQKFEVICKGNQRKSAVECIAVIRDRLKTKNTAATLLAILGWTSTGTEAEMDPESQTPSVCLGCQLCLATMEIRLISSANEDSDRPPKRQKKLARYDDPHNAHRHYCPQRCGWPTSMLGSDTPLWQIVLCRLVTQAETSSLEAELGSDALLENNLDSEESVAKIRKILMSGVLHKEFSLEADGEDYSFNSD